MRVCVVCVCVCACTAQHPTVSLHTHSALLSAACPGHLPLQAPGRRAVAGHRAPADLCYCSDTQRTVGLGVLCSIRWRMTKSFHVTWTMLMFYFTECHSIWRECRSSLCVLLCSTSMRTWMLMSGFYLLLHKILISVVSYFMLFMFVCLFIATVRIMSRLLIHWSYSYISIFKLTWSLDTLTVDLDFDYVNIREQWLVPFCTPLIKYETFCLCTLNKSTSHFGATITALVMADVMLPWLNLEARKCCPTKRKWWSSWAWLKLFCLKREKD